MRRRRKFNADQLQSDLWMLEFYNGHTGRWRWQNFATFDVDLPKKIRREGGLSLMDAIYVSEEIFRRHGDGYRWRRIKGKDRVHVWDLRNIGRELKRLRRAAAKP